MYVTNQANFNDASSVKICININQIFKPHDAHLLVAWLFSLVMHADITQLIYQLDMYHMLSHSCSFFTSHIKPVVLKVWFFLKVKRGAWPKKAIFYFQKYHLSDKVVLHFLFNLKSILQIHITHKYCEHIFCRMQ